MLYQHLLCYSLDNMNKLSPSLFCDLLKWYKNLIKGYGLDDTNEIPCKFLRQLKYTEFVLLKWEMDKKGKLKIVGGYNPDSQLYALPNVGTALNVDYAREVDFGDDYYDDGIDDDERGDEMNNHQYRDYDELNENGGDYDGYDDYEESLYEKALNNLMNAKQQYNMASRLLARERRMKAPAHRYY